MKCLRCPRFSRPLIGDQASQRAASTVRPNAILIANVYASATPRIMAIIPPTIRRTLFIVFLRLKSWQRRRPR